MQGKHQNNARVSNEVANLENEILNSLTSDSKTKEENKQFFPADFSASGTGKGGGGNTGSIEL
ncbi:hypothetical protein LOC67_07440 [Stieleria sp. JC731]|uniref:hypothetical protein n=1 Tax=Pirellulaceae TaxID=2691357 RepID=UPI001E607B7F|nr:hypothetical protein [Stieleria sp. JC731]MCC9600389.1 hypothetical protein [Stieleria sp. JC731]